MLAADVHSVYDRNVAEDQNDCWKDVVETIINPRPNVPLKIGITLRNEVTEVNHCLVISCFHIQTYAVKEV